MLSVSLLLAAGLSFAQSETTPAPADPAAGIQASDESVRSGGRTAPLTEEGFVKAAAQTALAETELSRIALERSRNLRVNVLANRSLQEQEKIGSALRTAAGKQRVVVPERLDVDHQAMVSTLRLQPSEKFDQAYVVQMRESRNRAVVLFEQAKNSNSLSAPLRQFASASLEVVRAGQENLQGLVIPPKSAKVVKAASR